MRILFCGDVVGRSGREVVQKYIPSIKKLWALDAVVINGENAHHGFGLSQKTCAALYASGADVITAGNHVWDCREFLSYVETDPRVIRPLNCEATVPGRGATLFPTPKGNLLVISLMGQVEMRPQLDNPFPIVRDFLKTYPPLGSVGDQGVRAILVDFHAEASAEKMAMGYFLDGLVSLVVGTHTHVPSADTRILECGTGYMTDAGMCGDYQSVIGYARETIQNRYVRKVPELSNPGPARGEGTLCGVFLETDDQTGLAKRIEPVRLGPNLSEAWPSDVSRPECC